MSADIIGDFLTVIRNGILVSKKSVTSPYSKLKHQIAEILKDEGYINNVSVQKDEMGHNQLKILLKYALGESVIHEITRISKPGGRSYSSVAHIEPVKGGLGISILTTNKGIITNKQAKKLSIGGEVLCTVW